MVVEILVALFVAAVLMYAAKRLLPAFGIGEPVKSVVYVVIVVLLLWFILRALGVSPI